jgi:hypothetical protein
MSIELNATFYYDENFNVYTTPYEAWNAKKQCYFYYYDKSFAKFDWKTEPTKSLQQLYLERAQQIRHDYEYVILCYSGGNDSSNILETFYYNNIHIDEIVVVGAFSQDKSQGTDDNHNADVYFNAIPTINSMNLLNTKITIIDYAKFFTDINQFSLIKEHNSDYFKYIGTHTSPHNLFWRDFRSFVGKDNNKKTAWIIGAEKVELAYAKGAPYAYFKDATVYHYGMNYIDENFERINFYNGYHNEAVMIQIKQAHILHQALSTIEDKQQKKNMIASRFFKNKIFYEKKHIKLAHQSDKSTARYLSLRDTFLKNNTNSDLYSVYVDGLKKYHNYCKSGVKYISKPYFIT